VAAWTAWLIPIATMLLLGFGAAYYLKKIRLPQEETAAGIAALAGMRWRDYIHLVLAALNRRGYERVFDPRADNSDENDYELQRNGQTWLLSSKHGSAYVLGSTAIAEFANDIRMRGAAGGLLVTSGNFAPEARPLAQAQRIELLDGPQLWPELRHLMPTEQRESIARPAQTRARRHAVVAWLGAVLVGIVLFVLLRPASPSSTTEQAGTPEAMAPTSVQSSGAAGATAIAAPPPAAPVTDPAQLEQHRQTVADAISTLPSVDHAVWSTQSTLLVYLSDDNTDPKPRICPLLMRYDELAASRIQLQPPAGSTHPVRFVQCRYY